MHSGFSKAIDMNRLLQQGIATLKLVGLEKTSEYQRCVPLKLNCRVHTLEIYNSIVCAIEAGSSLMVMPGIRLYHTLLIGMRPFELSSHDLNGLCSSTFKPLSAMSAVVEMSPTVVCT